MTKREELIGSVRCLSRELEAAVTVTPPSTLMLREAADMLEADGELHEALEFYEKHLNVVTTGDYDTGYHRVLAPSKELISDAGFKARKALAKARGEDDA